MLDTFARISLVAVLGAATLLAAACSSGGGQTGTAGVEKPDLTVAAVPSLDSAGLYIAQQRGLFAAQGLHVTIVPAVSSSTVISGQLAGKYDVTVGAYVAYMLADALHHANLRILAPSADEAPLTQEVLVAPGSAIQTVGQLKGKRIGVNVLDNLGQLLVSALLSDNGVSPSEVHFVPIPFPDLAAALRTHRVDAAWLPEPFITEAEESTGATVLADADQGSTQNLPVNGFAVTQSWLKKYPRTAAAFRRAILEAQSIANTNLSAVEQGMVAGGGVSRATSEIVALPTYPLKTEVGLLQRLASLMEQYGMTQQLFNAAQLVHG
jgi:NitT/TauT family transport system substrate-binding protein